jgi:2-oxoglutarate ferredoxin oxidoreductase subunit gamma
VQTEIVIAGFGGQGVLFAGELLAHAGMSAGQHVTWFPSYGPEMRGGTANCTVIISDDEIGSPVVRYPKAALVMNLPSLDKYETRLIDDGVIIVNSSLVNRTIQRKDIKGVYIPASEIAEKIAERRLTNMVMLGAFLAHMPIISVDQVKQSIEEEIPERHRRLLAANLQAISEGYNYAT